MNKVAHITSIVMMLNFALLISGCGIYSFTGASVSPEVETFSVELFKDQSQANPEMKQAITEKLLDKMVTNTSLSAVRADGDLKFTGTILSYDVNPITTTSTEVAAESRLKVIVQVEFINEYEEENNFSQNFTAFADFPRNTSFNSVETALVEDINDQLVDEIFNKALVNW